ncbi:MAG: ribosome assembly cofactor RimP [Bilophila sp.]
MSQSDRIEFISHLVAPLAASLGLEIWGIEIGGAARPTARIYVDTAPGTTPLSSTETATPTAPCEEMPGDVLDDLVPNGVSIDQCAELSRLAGLALDVEDPFADNWTLEISSPGLERPFFKIDQMRPYTGREVEIILSAPLDNWPGRKKFSGVLTVVADEECTLALPAERRMEHEPEHVIIAWPLVRKATLIHTFPEQSHKPGLGSKPGKAGKPGKTVAKSAAKAAKAAKSAHSGEHETDGVVEDSGSSRGGTA